MKELSRRPVTEFVFGGLFSGSGSTVLAVYTAWKNGRLPHLKLGGFIASKYEEDGATGISKLEKAGFPKERIEVIRPKDYATAEEYGQAIIDQLEAWGVTLVGQLGHLPMTPANVCNHYAGRIFNQHPGWLNRGQDDFGGKGMHGIAVHTAVTLYAAKLDRPFYTQATTHLVTEKVDDGAVLKYKNLRVRPEDTPDSLQKRLLPLEWELVIATLQAFYDGTARPVGRRRPIARTQQERLWLSEAKAEAIRQCSKR